MSLSGFFLIFFSFGISCKFLSLTARGLQNQLIVLYLGHLKKSRGMGVFIYLWALSPTYYMDLISLLKKTQPFFFLNIDKFTKLLKT